jgi:hypothetical protein
VQSADDVADGSLNPSFHEVIHRLFHIFLNSEAQPMPETCAVELHVQLPQSLADEVQRVKENDPEALSRIVAYGVTRRAIFDHLVDRSGLDRLPSRPAY